MRIISLLILICALNACATFPNERRRDLDMKSIDNIKIGDDASDISTVLGKPSEVRTMKNESNSEFWIYNDADESQRAAIEINSQTKKVVGTTIIPREAEPEFKLDFLLKSKFASLSFEKIRLQICSL